MYIYIYTYILYIQWLVIKQFVKQRQIQKKLFSVTRKQMLKFYILNYSRTSISETKRAHTKQNGGNKLRKAGEEKRTSNQVIIHVLPSLICKRPSVVVKKQSICWLIHHS